MILNTELISSHAPFFSLQKFFFSNPNLTNIAISVKLRVSPRPAVFFFARFLADALAAIKAFG